MAKMQIEHKKIVFYSLLYGLLIFLVFGFITRIIPNNFFARMTPTNNLDYIFLVLTSLLLGTYISLNKYQKHHSKSCSASAYSGGIFGFLGFGCALCNKILLFILGVGGVLTYVEPYRPIMGSLGIILMSYATYNKGKKIYKK